MLLVDWIASSAELTRNDARGGGAMTMAGDGLLRWRATLAMTMVEDTMTIQRCAMTIQGKEAKKNSLTKRAKRRIL